MTSSRTRRPILWLVVWLAVWAISSHGFTSSTKRPASKTIQRATDEDSETATIGSGWKPTIESLEDRKSLRNSQRSEVSDSETIGSIRFHHVEFYCGDAKSTAHLFSSSLGMSVTGTTSQSTGNDQCVSYGLESGEEFRLLLTAPYSRACASFETDGNDQVYDAPSPLPGFDLDGCHTFFQKHGLAARAIGIEVKDAETAFRTSVENGAVPVLEPTPLKACPAQKSDDDCTIAEVELYGDVVLRYISFKGGASNRESDQPFLPHLAPFRVPRKSYGIYRIDHAVGNVHDLQEAYSRIRGYTGFHEFAEFTSEDVGTVDSGLNSVVLASDSEEVLLPLNEPTQGRRKSQIQTYLEQNEGPGLQHLALKTRDIFATVRKMRETSENDGSLFGGFELMKRPSDEYYRELPDRLGDQLTPEQYEELEELGILADSDEEGILLQLFTKPIGDRPTFFFEIIQRIGCIVTYESDDAEDETIITTERPGCGGFGQGNFRELFKSIEDHEKTLKV